VGSWRVLADIESGTRENEVITPWSQIPNLIQLVQGTEQALPLYDPVHGPHLLPTAMIRYMVVVLARPIFCGVLARPILADIESGTRENEVITPWSQIPNLIQSVQGTEQGLPLYDPDALATHANPDMWKEYQLLPVPPPAPIDGIG
jgi:hypothetical protein